MGVLHNIQTLIGKKENSGQPQSTTDAKTLLIVEDEPILREMYRDKFVIEGYNVITAENGQEGLDKVVTDKPDIILLDLMMPVMDGEAMLHHLRNIPDFKEIPVLVLTNAGEVDNIKSTKLYYNAIEFMIKSNVNLEQITARVKRMIL